MTFRNSVVGGTTLVRPAVRSPNYVAGSTGWSIDVDGSAEFNDITIRGATLTQGEILMYNGTPASGNLIISVAPASGTDSFGNAFRAGFTSYGDSLGNDITTQLTGGLLTLESNLTSDQVELDFTGVELDDTSTITKYLNTRVEFVSANDDPVFNDPGGLLWAINDGSEIQRYLRLTSGDDTSNSAAFMWLFGEDASANDPYVRIDDGANGVCDVQHHGTYITDTACVHGTLSGGVIVADTWQTPSYNTNWSGATTFSATSGFQSLQYRRDAEDNVWLYGCFTATGAVSPDIFALPAGYRPATNRAQVPVNFFDTSASTVDGRFLQILTNGNVSIGGGGDILGSTVASGDDFFVNGKFPLGNLS